MPALPESVHVIERGWLSSNSVLARDSSGCVLVDSGYVAHATQTLALVERALAGARLERLVNTHCHSDHMGGNAAIRRRHGCRITVPAGEAPLVAAWDETALILAFADQRAERFPYDDVIAPGDAFTMGGLEWQAFAAPGHDPHALMFYAPQARLLISGDALWQNGFGVVFGALFDRPQALAETRGTLEAIATLDVRTVIPGHGAVFGDVAAALERAFARLESYERDITRLARHCLKVMLAFSLLEKRQIALADLPAYLAGVPLVAEVNRRHLGLAPVALAEWLVQELERAGAAARENGRLVPRIAA